MIALPRIMVAPNGARRTKQDHPALPISIDETVETARACFAAGAKGLHAHVRDSEGQHVLDAGLYKELLAEMAQTVPEMMVQITTEAVGKYTPAEQRALVRAVNPGAVSVSLREMLTDGETPQVRTFYHEAHASGIAIQHILYDATDIERLLSLTATNYLPNDDLQALIVLGRYSDKQEASPTELADLITLLRRLPQEPDWAVCAFGRHESTCLKQALDAGGKVRIGFENNFQNADGTIASNNAERLAEIVRLGGRN